MTRWCLTRCSRALQVAFVLWTAPAAAVEPPEQLQGKLQSEYVAVKETFDQLLKEGALDQEQDFEYASMEKAIADASETNTCTICSGSELVLPQCRAGSEYVPESDDDGPDRRRVHFFSEIAYQHLTLQLTLQATPYPPRLWQPILNRGEEAQVQYLGKHVPAPYEDGEPFFSIQDEMMSDLENALNTYRKAHGNNFPLVSLEEGCGDAAVGIHIATDPRGGRARFIAVFDYVYCERRGLDPENENKCTAWREPVDGILFAVAGEYRYKVNWPDGSSKKGKYRFETLTHGDTATIRK
jgi:hypothetical protein